MKESKHIYLSLILIIIIFFGVVTLYTINTAEIPRFINFLGRFHPLLLHLPIGVLVVTFFLDILGRFQKNYPKDVIRNMLAFVAIFSIVTCFLGYFLSLEGGYQKETLNLHLYTGIATGIVTSVLLFISLESNFNTNKAFLPIFSIALVLIGFAGHFGSVLTHGDNFLTEYAATKKKARTIKVIDSLKLYNDVIGKILEKKCVSCHNETKQKGALSLISKEEILKGGESGKSILAGDAAQSLLYQQLLLPISDKSHMPPEGKQQLTKDEVWLLEYWINSGIDFDNYVNLSVENDTLRKKLIKYLVFKETRMAKALPDVIEEVEAAGFRIFELVPGKAALNVKLLQTKPTKKTLNKLSSIKEQIVELDLGTFNITDDMTTVLRKFKNLKQLRLNSNKITDRSIGNIKNLKNLKILNIYNTQISNNGIRELLETIQPKRIYTWQTAIKNETARSLEKEFNVSIQNSITKDFVSESRLEMPMISPSRTLFTDTIHIRASSRLKNVKLYYTLDGKSPDTTATIFDDKLILNTSKTFKIAAFKKGWQSSEILTRDYAKLSHTITNFTIKKEPDERYPEANKLFDMEEGSLSFKDGNWTGFFGSDMDVTLDLETIKSVNNVSFNCIEDVGSWILFPTHYTIYTADYKNGPFKKVKETSISREGEGGGVPEIKKVTLKLADTRTRYIRIHIKNYKKLPEWHPSAGNPSWLFVDEIYFW